jgi:uncharacterized protein YigE (DUF2233 family)
MRFLLGVLAIASLSGEASAACGARVYNDAGLVVCEFSPPADDIRLFLRDEAGAPYFEFDALNAALAAQGKRLLFAMNAGMYAKDRSPVGLYVEAGEELKRLNTNDGPGNFHLKPNGVFWSDASGVHVAESAAYKPSGDVTFATQSGPMLVIDGAIHPKFKPDSESKKRRNGVGVSEDGAAVFFVLADTPVTFHAFAAFFKDELKTPNALFLDGTISRLYAPELSRSDEGFPMGPIVGVVADAE